MSHIVIIGAGPVGRAFASRLQGLDPAARISLIASEPPCRRIELGKLLAGEVRAAELLESPPSGLIVGEVSRIDRASRTVFLGETPLPYDRLVLATGAMPVMLPGAPAGVFSLRCLADAEAIAAAASGAASIVVIGGGTLGIEAAAALGRRRPQAAVTLLHGGPALLDRMLDTAAAAHLAEVLRSAGVAVRLNAPAREFLGRDGRLAGIRLGDGEVIAADLVVSAIGVRANDALARQAGLACADGVVADGEGRTSDPAIFAIGDCVAASDRLLASGFRQAEAAAHALAGRPCAAAPPALAVNRLKIGPPVCALGQSTADRAIVHRRPGVWRKLFLAADGRLLGAIAFGAWDELPAIEQAIREGRRLSRLRRLAFRSFGTTGLGAPAQGWPDDAIVCQCRRVDKAQIAAAARQCAGDPVALGRLTGAGTGCGGCRPLLAGLLGKQAAAAPHHRIVGRLAAAACVLAALLLVFSLPYPERFRSALGWLWRDPLAKQASGFCLLALAAGLAAIGIRKRAIRRAYDNWQLAHAALGLFALVILLAHAGGRFGSGLTLGLSLSFLGTALVGALLAGVMAQAHRLPPARQATARRTLHWAHVLLLWPFPVLLGSHVVQTYLWS